LMYCSIVLLHWLSMTFNFGLNPLLAKYSYTLSNASFRDALVWSRRGWIRMALDRYSYATN
jgi:hypothetical protein